MKQFNRILIAFIILLSGLVLLPRSSLLGGVVRWQQFTGGYGAEEYPVYLPQIVVDQRVSDTQ